MSWSEAKRDRKDPGWRDRGQRAYANGISLDAQRIVDGAIQFEDGPLFQALDRHYVKLAQEHDLSLALLERLRQRPYWRLGNEIADLPAAQFQRIAREVEVLAQDRTASALTREEAVRALGRVSQPRVERNGELLARPSDLEGLTRLEFRGQSEALREMLAGELTEENRMRARKLLKRVDPSFR